MTLRVSAVSFSFNLFSFTLSSVSDETLGSTEFAMLSSVLTRLLDYAVRPTRE